MRISNNEGMKEDHQVFEHFFLFLVLKHNEIISFMNTHSLGRLHTIEHDSSISSVFMTRVTGMAERLNDQSTGRLINLLQNVKR